jgi:hypothetical protein
MSRNDKSFDCVALKERLQAQLREEEERLGPEEVRRRHRIWVNTSDDPLARWLRALEAKSSHKAG